MFWIVILLLLIVLMVVGLGSRRQAADRAKQIENEIVALAAGLRRQNQSYAAITDTELVVSVMKHLSGRRRPTGSLFLGSAATLIAGIIVARATAPYPSLVEAALVVLFFLSSFGFSIWGFVNMVRNMKKPNLQSIVEETLKGLAAETVG